MEKTARIYLSGIILSDNSQYKINDYFTLSKYKNHTVLFAKITDNPPLEATPYLLLYSLYLTFPDTLISTYCSESPEEFYKQLWPTNVLFSYYGDTEYKCTPKTVDSNDIQRLIKWYSIIFEYNTTAKVNTDARCLPWNVAWNEYIDACSCSVVEKAFAHLITALEALLVDSTSELNYRVSLHSSIIASSNVEERIKVFNCVKTSYDYRSKSVHGDGKSMKKRFKSETIYSTFFELKQIVATVMEITYQKDKKDIMDAIITTILSCPEVKM